MQQADFLDITRVYYGSTPTKANAVFYRAVNFAELVNRLTERAIFGGSVGVGTPVSAHPKRYLCFYLRGKLAYAIDTQSVNQYEEFELVFDAVFYQDAVNSVFAPFLSASYGVVAETAGTTGFIIKSKGTAITLQSDTGVSQTIAGAGDVIDSLKIFQHTANNKFSVTGQTYDYCLLSNITDGRTLWIGKTAANVVIPASVGQTLNLYTFATVTANIINNTSSVVSGYLFATGKPYVSLNLFSSSKIVGYEDLNDSISFAIEDGFYNITRNYNGTVLVDAIEVQGGIFTIPKRNGANKLTVLTIDAAATGSMYQYFNDTTSQLTLNVAGTNRIISSGVIAQLPQTANFTVIAAGAGANVQYLDINNAVLASEAVNVGAAYSIPNGTETIRFF